MDFKISSEQEMVISTTKAFVEKELYPHEELVEKTGAIPQELLKEIQKKAIDAGLYAANIPEEFGGGGLDTLSWLLFEKELGLKSILMGFGLNSNDIHSPNEHYGVFNYLKGIETIPFFFHYFNESSK